jgi:predicted nucleic acid-binding protein
MNDKIFIDSNVLIYAHTDLDLHKQSIAQEIITNDYTVISTQVLQEASNILFKKFKFSWAEILVVIREAAQNNKVHINTPETVIEACRIANRYGFSFYDSLILAAALESGCVKLESEDLQNNQNIDNLLIVENPFQLT